jgi:hypothetical protein
MAETAGAWLPFTWAIATSSTPFRYTELSPTRFKDFNSRARSSVMTTPGKKAGKGARTPDA